MALTRREKQNLRWGLGFLAPNILGFLAFTIIPLLFSLVLAFSNWDLTLHNVYKDEPLQFVGVENFRRLLSQPDFWRFLGNTLFLMMGIPFSIAGSLFLAILLSQDLRGERHNVKLILVAGSVMVSSVLMLVVVGANTTAMTVLLCGFASVMLIGGAVGGSTVYRTLFYTPHFTAGVATYILWKKLYNPHQGPINLVLAEPLDRFGKFIASQPAAQVQLGFYAALVLVGLVTVLGLRTVRRMADDGLLGSLAVPLPLLILLIAPSSLLIWWSPSRAASLGLLAFTAAWAVVEYLRSRLASVPVEPEPWDGLGNAFMLATGLMVVSFVLLGLGLWCWHLPALASDGLEPPNWLTDYHWAKPAIMLMGIWGSVGSNNMLLYLAGLSNVPVALYEAASIDGATGWQKFWNVTWPQLAPVTFYIVVMSVIGGLQGGFEMARTMTRGGPAGSTTTLSYYIYNEGFVTGRLGFSSAVAWALFLLVFGVTMFNWRFGNRYVNN